MYLLISLIYTWGIGLLPAFIIRRIVKRPIRKLLAIFIAGLFWMLQLILTLYINELAGVKNNSHTALSLVALASYYLLVRK